MSARTEFLAAVAADPTITGLHANIRRDAPHPEFPWNFTVDFTTAEAPLGDMNMSSLDYGSMPTHKEALEAAEAIIRDAKKEQD